MRLRTFLKGVASVGVVATVTLIGAVKAIDLDKVKVLLAAEVKAATGRELTIGGPLRLKLGWSPTVTAERVSLANAPGGSRKDMLVVERVEAEMALVPLLKHSVVVKRLLLVGPDLLVEADAKGRGNWRFAPGSPAPEVAGAPPVRFDIGEFLIKNGRINWPGGDSVALHKVVLQPNPDGQRLRLVVVGDWRATSFDAAGTVGALSAIGPAKPWPVQLNGSIGHSLVVVEGAVADPLAGRGFDLRLQAQGDEVARPLTLAGIFSAGRPAPAIGPFKLSAHWDDSAGMQRVTEIDLAIGRRELAVVSAKGEIRNVTAGQGIDLRLGVESDNLAGLSQLSGFPLPPIGPVKLAAHLIDDGAGMSFGDIKARLGDSDLAGDVTFVPGPRPHLAGTLGATSLDLSDLTSPAAKAGEKRAERVKPAAKAGARLFSDEPLALMGLGAIDADLTLNAARLMVEGVELDALAAKLSLDRGRLAVSAESGRLAGGTLAGALTLDVTAGHDPMVAARLDANGADLGRLVREVFDSRAINGGVARLHLDAKAQGNSVRALMTTLDGELLVAIGEAHIDDGAIDWTATDALTRLALALDPAVKAAADTSLRCAVVRLQARDGVASARKGIAAETGRNVLLGDGSINLDSETLALAFAAKAAGQVTGAARVGGSLLAPAITTDTVDGVGIDDHPCQTALGQPAPRKQVKRRPPAGGRP